MQFRWLWANFRASGIDFENLNFVDGIEMLTVLMRTGRGVPLQDFYSGIFEPLKKLQENKAWQHGNETLQKHSKPGMVGKKKCFMTANSSEQLMEMARAGYIKIAD